MLLLKQFLHTVFHSVLVTFLYVLTCLPVFSESTHITLKFAQLSDLHMMANGPDGSWLLLKDAPQLLSDALEQLEAMGDIKFLLITGNSVNSPGTEHFDRLFKVLEKTSIPIYFCLGNRDITGTLKANTIQKFMAFTQKGFSQGDKGYYSFSPVPTVKVLVLDSTPTDAQVTGRGVLGREQLDWVQQELEREAMSASPKTIIVAMHHPLVEPYASPGRRLTDPDRSRLMGLLEGSPLVSMVISGNYHAAKMQVRNQILHISTPSLVDFPNAFRVFTLTDNGQVHAQWVPTRLTDLQQKSKNRSPWTQVSEGMITDHRWQGALKFYPTPSALAAFKAKEALKVVSSKPAVLPPTNMSAAIFQMLPKPAPLTVEQSN